MRPFIGVSGCAREDDTGRVTYTVGDKYIHSLADAIGATPVMIPPIGARLDADALLDRIDGLFLTGSPSNIHPTHYNTDVHGPEDPRDPYRDSTTLPLIRRAIDRGTPVFAVCRGHQELNVALGGTLHQMVQELHGKRDHRADKALDYNDQYDQRHSVQLSEGGLLAGLNGGAGAVMVNSLHAQAIDAPAEGLSVEAVSDDGVIEAVSMPGAPGFVLGVQWHPEHPMALNWPLSQAMFQAFGRACRNASKAPAAAMRAAATRTDTAA
ncbi:MAG: gamma-glutamyl-gamma-aminobutyrate hydrolase family protein [Alphaproteobacteria bacterium]|nr:gamma-glutamyl-gamma-aminobutyrate hydrolase family protein [Alphaproteobacteria bacterium]